MRKRSVKDTTRFWVVVAGLALVTTGLVAQDRPVLEIREAVDSVLSENAGLQRSRLEELEAQAGYDSARAGIGPQVDLDLDAYTLDQRRIEVRGEATRQNPLGEEQGRTSQSHSSAGTLRFSQSLPTGGRVSADGSVETSASRRLEEGDLESTDAEWEVEPSVSLQFSQPIFVNGRLVDIRIAREIDREAYAGVRNAEVARRQQENSTVLAAVELYLVIANLRETVDTLEFSRSVLQRQIERTEDDVEAGVASRQQLLQTRLSENRTRESLLETREQLRSLERSFARVTGGELEPDEYRFARAEELFESIEQDVRSRLEELGAGSPEQWPIEENAAVKRGQIQVETARSSAITADSDRAPEFSVATSVTRRYPDERDDPAAFAGAFGDLFDGDGGFDWNVSLRLGIPIFDGGRRQRERDADELSVQLAELERQEAQKDAREDLAERLEQLEILVERIEILQADRDFEQDQVENLESLREINSATGIEVDEALVDLRESENSIVEVRTDLVLTLLEVDDLLGRSVADGVSQLLE